MRMFLVGSGFFRFLLGVIFSCSGDWRLLVNRGWLGF